MEPPGFFRFVPPRPDTQNVLREARAERGPTDGAVVSRRRSRQLFDAWSSRADPTLSSAVFLESFVRGWASQMGDHPRFTYHDREILEDFWESHDDVAPARRRAASTRRLRRASMAFRRAHAREQILGSAPFPSGAFECSPGGSGESARGGRARGD